jgi:hypothetical protein
VTGHLTYDANVARLEDLHGRAERRRTARRAARTSIPASTQTRVGVAEPVTIRRATADDRATLERLAALDSAPALVGDVLIAEVGDEALGAIEVATGATIADPFRPTAELVELLSLRAARLRGGSDRRRSAQRRVRIELQRVATVVRRG